MTRKLVERGVISIMAIVFGVWVIDWLPDVVAVPLLVVGSLLLLVDFTRWLDRKAY